MRRATALAVPVRRLSWYVSSHFYAIHSLCVPCSKIAKDTKTSYFENSRSFKVIDINTIKKLVTNACYNKQHVCTYLQAFFMLHNSIAVK